MNSAHIQVVKSSFGFKGGRAHFGVDADEIPLPPATLWRSPMRNGFYLSVLDHGSPLAVKAASIAVSTVLFLIVALPLLAVASAVVA